MSPTCSICLESFHSPVSLPCGHVFCRECIRRTVESIKPRSVQQCCPACRAPYNILTIDPALIPPYLRPHILPPIRKVFLDGPSSPVASTSAAFSSDSTAALSLTPSVPSADVARAAAELTALKQECATWRRRAEIHAAGNARLLGFARAAKDCALRLRTERDMEHSRCVLLKRKLAELMPEFDPVEFETESIFTEKRKQGAAAPAPCGGLPVFLMQCKPPADMELSRLGPPMKRRKESPRRESVSPAPPDPAVPDSDVLTEAAFVGSTATLSSRRLSTLEVQ